MCPPSESPFHGITSTCECSGNVSSMPVIFCRKKPYIVCISVEKHMNMDDLKMLSATFAFRDQLLVTTTTVLLLHTTTVLQYYYYYYY